MKIKVVGFKVGQSRPTANRTIVDFRDHVGKGLSLDQANLLLGDALFDILDKSDFITIRRVDK